MDFYNNTVMVYDATQDKDIEVLAPSYQAACAFEEFLSTKSEDITQYCTHHNIVMDFEDKDEYDPRRKSDADIVTDFLNSPMTGTLSIKPLIIGLLIPLDNALDHVRHKLNRPGMSKSQLQSILKKHQIYNLPHIDDLVTLKQKLINGKTTKRERDAMLKRLEDLAKHLEVATRRIEFKWGRPVIFGKLGHISYIDNPWHVVVPARSKRHLRSVSRQLSFMRMVNSDPGVNENEYELTFKLDRMPTPDEADIIRRLVGLNRASKKNKTKYRETLKNTPMISSNLEGVS